MDYKVKYYKQEKPKSMPIGITQILKETPKIVKRVRDAVIYTLAGSLTMSAEIAELIGTSAEKYGTMVGVAILLTKGVSMLFGVNDETK